MNHLLISRTDAIGDVVLTLPLAGYLKELFPQAKISFLGKAYTGPVIRCNKYVDEFIDYNLLQALGDEEQVDFLKEKKIDAIIHVFPSKHLAALAKQAGIKCRIGTRNRVFHWFTCNKLVKLSRKKSNLHEAQLNLVLLKPLGLQHVPALVDIIGHNPFKPTISLPTRFQELLSKYKFNIILHPKSHGSGAEWGLDKFKTLAEKLPSDKFKIIISGSEREQALLRPWIATLPAEVLDLTGQMTLDEFITFIANADGLVASGTGPLHLAAAAGIHALGLFPSIRPIYPGRWGPLGKKASYLESGSNNLEGISVEMVVNRVNKWIQGLSRSVKDTSGKLHSFGD